MDEKEVTVYLREWLKNSGFLVYTGGEFTVTDGHGQPDMVIIKNIKNGDSPWNSWNSVIEVKRSRDRDISLAPEQIMRYAHDYCYGAKYTIDRREQKINCFLVATDLSPKGRLFEDDNHLDNKRKRKDQHLYERYPDVDPYYEWQRTHDFVRSMWKQWRNRENMRNVGIGILLSSKNDKTGQIMLNTQPTPKRLITHFEPYQQCWQQRWM